MKPAGGHGFDHTGRLDTRGCATCKYAVQIDPELGYRLGCAHPLAAIGGYEPVATVRDWDSRGKHPRGACGPQAKLYEAK